VRVRLPLDLVQAVDAAAAQLQLERPGQRISRAEALRVLLAEACAARGIQLR
jgi:hypothetical protein